jgi:hypothetical protein
MKKIIFPLLLGLVLTLSGCSVVRSIQPVATPASSGTLLFSDEFNDNSNSWGLSSDDSGAVSLLYQGMDIRIDQSNTMRWTVANPKFTDTRVDVDAVLLAGPTDDAYGTVCRFEDDQHFYGFIVTHDGYYGIFKMQDGQVILSDTSGGLKFSELIRQGGVVNHITTVCQSDTLSLSVNGQVLAEVEDDSYPSGQIGLIAGTYSTSGVEVFFDNLLVTQP